MRDAMRPLFAILLIAMLLGAGGSAEAQSVTIDTGSDGELTERVIQRTVELAREKGIPVITDPKIG